jgi:hypothetical protein
MSVFSSAGLTTVAGLASYTQPATASSSGSSVASGVGVAYFVSVFSASGESIVDGVGRTSLHGVTRNEVGTPLGTCSVKAFVTADDTLTGSTTSDGSGNWVIYPSADGPYYLVSYKTGSPDVAGTTVNTLEAD